MYAIKYDPKPLYLRSLSLRIPWVPWVPWAWMGPGGAAPLRRGECTQASSARWAWRGDILDSRWRFAVPRFPPRV